MYSLTRSIWRALTADAELAAIAERAPRKDALDTRVVGARLLLPCKASTRKEDSSQNMRLRSWNACSILMSRFAVEELLTVKGK